MQAVEGGYCYNNRAAVKMHAKFGFTALDLDPARNAQAPC